MSELEHRYIVFKRSDLAAIASAEEIKAVVTLAERIAEYRTARGAANPNMEGVYIEKDWPMYRTVVREVLDYADACGAAPPIMAHVVKAIEAVAAMPTIFELILAKDCNLWRRECGLDVSTPCAACGGEEHCRFGFEERTIKYPLADDEGSHA